MKIGEYVNQGLKDTLQKKNQPLAKWLSLGGTVFLKKKIVPRGNGVFNIQGEAKQIQNRA